MIQTFETLHNLFAPEVQSSAFLDLQGHILSANTKSAAYFLSPIQAARFAISYFPLQDGDWMAVNDTHIGGVTPHGINFLGRLGPLIWSVRMESTLAWNLSEKWEDVGFKIPPLPIKISGEVNPHIPKNYLELVQPQVLKLNPLITKLKKYLIWKSSELSAQNLENFFQASNSALKSALKETPWIESQHKAKTASGEILNAKIQFQEKMCSIDLTGSSQSNQIQVCEKVVDSILVYALNKSLGSLSYYNQGTESFFQILKPRQSWLSHSSPKAPALAHLLGAPFLESHIKQMLLKMKRPVENWTCSKDGWFQVLENESKKFINSDQMRECWGQSCDFIKAQTATTNGLHFLALKDCEILVVQAGKILSQPIKSLQTFEYKIS